MSGDPEALVPTWLKFVLLIIGSSIEMSCHHIQFLSSVINSRQMHVFHFCNVRLESLRPWLKNSIW